MVKAKYAIQMLRSNQIISSKYNGILISGDRCHPKIQNNIVENNKKCGIKIEDNSKAEITERNVIKKNYNQGILIVEGCSAIITGNNVSQNLKANIAYGGQGSQYTRVERNEINGSVAEGIFIVEGHSDTLVRENEVNENKDGIVLYNSEGSIKENMVQYNQRSGILCGGQTDAEITDNKILSNVSIGVMIKDPSVPQLKANEICHNFYQLSLDKNTKRLEQYLTLNDVKGQNELPKRTCSIL